jgi:hypothetical protein
MREMSHHDAGHGTHEHHHDSADDPVLDIGGDVGALILRTGPEYLDREIELSPIGDDAARVHTAIHRRASGDQVVYAGLYPALQAGEYRVWADDPRLPDRVTIVGGAVSELDWTIASDLDHRSDEPATGRA